MLYGHQIWSEEPLTRVKHNAWVKGHIGVIQGQPGVKLLRNTLCPPNLVRTPDQSGTQCWVKGHIGVNQRSNYLLMITIWPSHLARRTPDLRAAEVIELCFPRIYKECWGRRSHRSHVGLTRGQNT